MKILIIGKVWVEPNSSAAGRRMKQLIELFRQRGEIHFACANTSTGNEIDLAEIGVTTHQIELNNDTVNDFFRELNPDIVVFDRFLTEEQYGWRIIEQCPDAIRILNTEDLHFLRKTRHQYVKKNNDFTVGTSILDFQNDETMRELASILRSDFSIMISKVEMELLIKKFSVKEEQLLYLPILAESKNVSYSGRDSFLFVGNILHEPNLDAVRILVREIWPRIRQRLQQAKLKIVGAYPTQEVLQMNKPQEGIDIIAHPKELESIYATAKVCLVPLRFGAGVKGKIIEAMEYKVPFVTTSIGAEGLDLEQNFPDCIQDDWDAFTQKAVELFLSEEVNYPFEKQLKQYHDPTVYPQYFLNQLDSALSNFQAFRNSNFIARVLQHHTLMSTRYLSKWIMEKEGKRSDKNNA
jgi:glycosyltransferase involved in cell wall biosynthesis